MSELERLGTRLKDHINNHLTVVADHDNRLKDLECASNPCVAVVDNRVVFQPTDKEIQLWMLKALSTLLWTLVPDKHVDVGIPNVSHLSCRDLIDVGHALLVRMECGQVDFRAVEAIPLSGD